MAANAEVTEALDALLSKSEIDTEDLLTAISAYVEGKSSNALTSSTSEDGSVVLTSSLSGGDEVEKKPVRVFLDGCFDLMHSGHFNALRQAKALGDILVAGVHSDAEILKHKGPTTFNDEERVALVKSCKFVDEIKFDVPYAPDLALLNEWNIDFCVHGDDMPTAADGTSAYDAVLKAGRCRVIKRTEGVSTTDIVGRMLLMTNEHHIRTQNVSGVKLGTSPSQTTGLDEIMEMRMTQQRKMMKKSNHFLPTTQRILKFANRSAAHLHEKSKVIYMDGAFDLFHIGHAETLEKAKALGDFLLVGIHDDATVNRVRGLNNPIMNLHERVLAVLSCKHVDEVIIGAPWVVTEDLIKTMNISVVAGGTTTKMPENELAGEEENNPYVVPKKMGIFHTIDSTRTTSTATIVARILDNREKFVARNKVRTQKEADYLMTREYKQSEV
eukprot:TRINITY_DN1082_c0_g1_i1.p2 TRINITY_DN1082_c0_g1~~TRINITY_DN1082_c0_g1_i1.p2  ORF type:complete len:442 (-),score=128.55 TRINITY_DN1082_c0_g1_i1:1735-3060(-)